MKNKIIITLAFVFVTGFIGLVSFGGRVSAQTTPTSISISSPSSGTYTIIADYSRPVGATPNYKGININFSSSLSSTINSCYNGTGILSGILIANNGWKYIANVTRNANDPTSNSCTFSYKLAIPLNFPAGQYRLTLNYYSSQGVLLATGQSASFTLTNANTASLVTNSNSTKFAINDQVDLTGKHVYNAPASSGTFLVYYLNPKYYSDLYPAGIIYPAGTSVIGTIIDVPKSYDGKVWWKVRFSSQSVAPSSEGWVAESDLIVTSTQTKPVPIVTLSTPSPWSSTITAGQSTFLAWQVTNNTLSSPTSCTASGGWTGTKDTGGGQTVSPTVTTTYTLTCTGPGGTSAPVSVTVAVGGGSSSGFGTIRIKRVNANLDVISGTQAKTDTSTPIFSTDNPSQFTSILAGSHTAYAVDLPGYDESVAQCSYTTYECSRAQASYYSNTGVTCSGGFCSVPVTVTANTTSKVVFRYTPTPIINTGTNPTLPPVPVVSISASPSSVSQGQSAILSWNISNLATSLPTSCDASAYTSSGAWLGTKALSGTQSVSPMTSTTYTLVCTGPGGKSVPASVIVNVAANVAPTATPNAPVINSLSFNQCRQGTSCRFEVKGSGFTPSGNDVRINNVSAGLNGANFGNLLLNSYSGSLVVDSPTTLTPGTYNLTVTNSNGTSNSTPFVIIPSTLFTTVTSISPSSGPLIDTTVILTGTGFAQNSPNYLDFIFPVNIAPSVNKIRVNVVSTDGTHLTVNVPSTDPVSGQRYNIPNNTVARIYVDNDEYDVGAQNATYTVITTVSGTRTSNTASPSEALGNWLNLWVK